MAKKIPEEVRRWYQKIGARGGQAGKGTEVRKELMRKNALIRWQRHREAQQADARALKKLFTGATPEVGAK